uniref:Uncharacterized protein n=1 Tax=Timema monikensis TaxID=170555 RepID=A0A7R9HT17_9NEOP|nr:unnamed protein product [Timema monikensis]
MSLAPHTIHGGDPLYTYAGLVDPPADAPTCSLVTLAHTIDTLVHTLALGTPGLISREPRTEYLTITERVYIGVVPAKRLESSTSRIKKARIKRIQTPPDVSPSSPRTTPILSNAPVNISSKLRTTHFFPFLSTSIVFKNILLYFGIDPRQQWCNVVLLAVPIPRGTRAPKQEFRYVVLSATARTKLLPARQVVKLYDLGSIALYKSLKCKLAFCKTIADECQPFLQRFQTSKPMTPYLFEAVEKLLRYLMNRCVKPDLMKCTGPKLLSIDTKKSENLILSKNIDIGFATKRLLGETAITVTERQKLEFIHECRSMLTTMIAKLQEKSPLKQKAVRGLSSLDPCVIQHSPQLAQKRFSFLLEELNHANIINDVLAENAKKEYLHFCNLKKSELQEIFRPCDQFSDEVGLDTIYGSFLIGEANYKHLWEVIKICLVLSHGNATVEGGFSVNKSLLVENMHEKTVIAQRHIHDEIQEAGGIKNIHISKKMLDYVRGARKRYHEYLEMKKQEKSEKDKKKAEKRKLDIQVKDLEGERKKLMMATEEKREAIDVELQELKKKQASLY